MDLFPALRDAGRFGSRWARSGMLLDRAADINEEALQEIADEVPGDDGEIAELLNSLRIVDDVNSLLTDMVGDQQSRLPVFRA